MTEQPPPSAEALGIAKRIRIGVRSFIRDSENAAEIDALCEQRVSAETERCAALVKPSMAFEECVYREAQDTPEFQNSITHADDFIRLGLTGILRREFREVERAIRAGDCAPAEMAEHREPPAPSGDKLIARLEAATEGSQELDEAVALAVGWERAGEYDERWHDPEVGLAWTEEFAPEFTRSLDAALTLLPEGWWLQHLGHNLAGWGARVERQGVSLPPSMRLDRCPTPALAVCIPALKARQTAPPTGPVELRERSNTDPQPDTTSATPPSPPAVVDYTERARVFYESLIFGDREGNLAKIAAALSAVASEHQAAIVQHPAADGSYLTPDGRKFWVDRAAATPAANSAGELTLENLAAGIVELRPLKPTMVAFLKKFQCDVQAAILARLREPEMREAVAKAIYNTDPIGVRAWEDAPMSNREDCLACADAALAVITEKLADAP